MNTKTKNILMYIIILAFMLRLGVFLYVMGGSGFETWEYEEIAKNLTRGDGFMNNYLGTVYRSCTTPLYPYFCAGLYKLFGINHAVISFFQIIFSTLTCLVIFDLARRVFDPAVGLLSALLFAVHPGYIYYSIAKIHPLVFDSLLLSLALWSFIYLKSELKLRKSFLAGMIVGLCIFTRSTIIAFLPIGFMWLLYNFRGQIKKALINMLFIAAGISIIIGPWVLRNYAVHGKLVLTTSADAEVFWRGNNVNASGTSYTESGSLILMEDPDLYRTIISSGEIEQRDLFRQEAVKFIKENPKKFVELFFRKLYYFWWFSPTSGLLYPPSYLALYKSLYAVSAVFFSLGLYGAWKGVIRADFANLLLTALFLVSISVFQSLFYVEGRHRWGIESVFLIISSAGLVSLFSIIQNRRSLA